jgi:hypothetical protein
MSPRPLTHLPHTPARPRCTTTLPTHVTSRQGHRRPIDPRTTQAREVREQRRAVEEQQGARDERNARPQASTRFLSHCKFVLAIPLTAESVLLSHTHFIRLNFDHPPHLLHLSHPLHPPHPPHPLHPRHTHRTHFLATPAIERPSLALHPRRFVAIQHPHLTSLHRCLH